VDRGAWFRAPQIAVAEFQPDLLLILVRELHVDRRHHAQYQVQDFADREVRWLKLKTELVNFATRTQQKLPGDLVIVAVIAIRTRKCTRLQVLC
jgi:hypothetical protein